MYLNFFLQTRYSWFVCMLIYFVNLCLSIVALRAFTFKIIVDMPELTSALYHLFSVYALYFM